MRWGVVWFLGMGWRRAVLKTVCSSFKEALIKSTRSDGERFWSQARFGKWGNTVCISHFSNRSLGEKDSPLSRRRFIQSFLRFILPHIPMIWKKKFGCVCRIWVTTIDYMIIAYTIRYYTGLLFHIRKWFTIRCQIWRLQGYWRIASSPILQTALSNQRLERAGLQFFYSYYRKSVAA